MLGKIWQFFKELVERLLKRIPLFSQNVKEKPASPPPTPRSDLEYEAMFMELLEGVNGGWSRGDVAGFLIAKRVKDEELALWLRRFGNQVLTANSTSETLEESSANDSLKELGRRLVLLSQTREGKLEAVAGEIGRGIFSLFPLPPVIEKDWRSQIIEAEFLGDGLG